MNDKPKSHSTVKPGGASAAFSSIEGLIGNAGPAAGFTVLEAEGGCEMSEPQKRTGNPPEIDIPLDPATLAAGKANLAHVASLAASNTAMWSMLVEAAGVPNAAGPSVDAPQSTLAVFGEATKSVERPSPTLTPEQKPDAKPADRPTSDAILCHDERVFSVPGTAPITVSEKEDAVLRVFLNKLVIDGELLKTYSGESRAPEVLRRLAKKYNGRFAPFIMLPGGKGKGGYKIVIRSAPSAS